MAKIKTDVPSGRRGSKKQEATLKKLLNQSGVDTTVPKNMDNKKAAPGSKEALLESLEGLTDLLESLSGDKSKRKVIRSKKVTPKVFKAWKTLDEYVEFCKKEHERLQAEMCALKPKADELRQRLWAVVGTDLGLWGNNLCFNEETNEIEEYFDGK